MTNNVPFRGDPIAGSGVRGGQQSGSDSRVHCREQSGGGAEKM